MELIKKNLEPRDFFIREIIRKELKWLISIIYSIKDSFPELYSERLQKSANALVKIPQTNFFLEKKTISNYTGTPQTSFNKYFYDKNGYNFVDFSWVAKIPKLNMPIFLSNRTILGNTLAGVKNRTGYYKLFPLKTANRKNDNSKIILINKENLNLAIVVEARSKKILTRKDTSLIKLNKNKFGKNEPPKFFATDNGLLLLYKINSDWQCTDMLTNKKILVKEKKSGLNSLRLNDLQQIFILNGNFGLGIFGYYLLELEFDFQKEHFEILIRKKYILPFLINRILISENHIIIFGGSKFVQSSFKVTEKNLEIKFSDTVYKVDLDDESIICFDCKLNKLSNFLK